MKSKKWEVDKKLKEVLSALATEDLSLTRAAEIIYGYRSDFHAIRAEREMDELWDRGLCINLGEVKDYQYRITKKGHDHLQKLLASE